MVRKNMTQEQRKARREYMRKWRAEHQEAYKEYMREYIRKYRGEHPECSKKCTERRRKRYAEDPEFRERVKEHAKKYMSEDLNSNGVKKSSIRAQSRLYLYSKHSKIEGYEVHHCFGYEDYKKFIYVPKELHLQIHKLLRDNNIPADSNHWNSIRDLVNSCEEYTYIRT